MGAGGGGIRDSVAEGSEVVTMAGGGGGGSSGRVGVVSEAAGGGGGGGVWEVEAIAIGAGMSKNVLICVSSRLIAA